MHTTQNLQRPSEMVLGCLVAITYCNLQALIPWGGIKCTCEWWTANRCKQHHWQLFSVPTLSQLQKTSWSHKFGASQTWWPWRLGISLPTYTISWIHRNQYSWTLRHNTWKKDSSCLDWFYHWLRFQAISDFLSFTSEWLVSILKFAGKPFSKYP